MLTHRAGPNELPCFQVLQIVVGDRRAGEDDRRDEERKGDEGSSIVRRRRHRDDQQRRAEHDRENADAGDRTIRRADETRHVTANPGDEKAA